VNLGPAFYCEQQHAELLLKIWLIVSPLNIRTRSQTDAVFADSDWCTLPVSPVITTTGRAIGGVVSVGDDVFVVHFGNRQEVESMTLRLPNYSAESKFQGLVQVHMIWQCARATSVSMCLTGTIREYTEWS